MSQRIPANVADYRIARNTVTFTGAASLGAVGSVPLFTVTGAVLVKFIAGYVGTSLTGASATIALGVTGSTSLFIGATTATGMTSTNNIWTSTSPTAAGLALATAGKEIIVTANIVGTVAVANVTGGVLTVWVAWLPLSSDGNVS